LILPRDDSVFTIIFLGGGEGIKFSSRDPPPSVSESTKNLAGKPWAARPEAAGKSIEISWFHPQLLHGTPDCGLELRAFGGNQGVSRLQDRVKHDPPRIKARGIPRGRTIAHTSAALKTQRVPRAPNCTVQRRFKSEIDLRHASLNQLSNVVPVRGIDRAWTVRAVRASSPASSGTMMSAGHPFASPDSHFSPGIFARLDHSIFAYLIYRRILYPASTKRKERPPL